MKKSFKAAVALLTAMTMTVGAAEVTAFAEKTQAAVETAPRTETGTFKGGAKYTYVLSSGVLILDGEGSFTIKEFNELKKRLSPAIVIIGKDVKIPADKKAASEWICSILKISSDFSVMTFEGSDLYTKRTEMLNALKAEAIKQREDFDTGLFNTTFYLDPIDGYIESCEQAAEMFDFSDAVAVKGKKIADELMEKGVRESIARQVVTYYCCGLSDRIKRFAAYPDGREMNEEQESYYMDFCYRTAKAQQDVIDNTDMDDLTFDNAVSNFMLDNGISKMDTYINTLFYALGSQRSMAFDFELIGDRPDDLAEKYFKECLSKGNFGKNVTWELDAEGTLTVSGKGYIENNEDSSYFRNEDTIGKIKKIVISDGVTSIGNGAFRDCENLESVTLPESLTSIGESAFCGCENLKSVTLPESLTSIGGGTFSDCSALTGIAFPESLTSIGDGAFSGCSALTGIAFPESLKSIGYDAFVLCSGLKSVTIPKSVTSIDSSAFSLCENLENITVSSDNKKFSDIDGVLFNKDKTEIVCYPNGKKDKGYTIPESVTRIGYGAFSDCSALTSITIPEGVKSIGGSAFYGCSALTSITIPEGVTSIGDEAFRCSAIKSIDIPEGVTSMGNQVFEDCSSLESVSLPDGMTSLGGYTFKGCSGLKSVIIPDSVKSIDSYTFENCSGLKSVIIPDSVTSIDSYTFDNCLGLKSVTIGKGVTSIGERAFSGCNALEKLSVSSENKSYSDIEGVLFNKDKTELLLYPIGKKEKEYTIPDGVTTIGYNVFKGCEGLENVILPESVTSIKDGAFKDTPFLESIKSESGIKYIGNVAYKADKDMTAAIIKKGTNGIADKAFYCCSSLKSVTFPESLKSIGDDAFLFCLDLTSVTIPESVTRIGYGAFAACVGLTDITIKNPDCEIGDNLVYIWDNKKWEGTVYGYKNSTAQEFAEKNGYFFKALDDTSAEQKAEPGDANFDGKVTVRDCAYIASCLASNKADVLSPEADFNGDGKVNVRDAAAIARSLAEIHK